MTLYQEIRAAGKSMYHKVTGTTEDFFDDLRPAARAMTIPVLGRTILLEHETMKNAFRDFIFDVYRVKGKSLAACADPVAADLTLLEADCLAAHIASRTSFFET